MNRLMAAGLLGGLVLIAGCGATLEGLVIEGPSSTAVIISADDERMSQSGIAGIPITLLRDNGDPLGKAVSNKDGVFKVTFDNQYSGKFRVRCRTERYENVSSTVFVPGPDKRLLVILDPVDPIDEDDG